MITKFKLFENINEDEPEVGDYVLCEEDEDTTFDFTKNKIGKYCMNSEDIDYPYYIEYDNIPDNLQIFFTDNCRLMMKNEIKYWSKDKNELEAILSTNKFNI